MFSFHAWKAGIALTTAVMLAGCELHTPEQINAMTNMRLCQMYTATGKRPDSPYLAQLMERKALSDKDLSDISTENIRTGMKSYVAVCSWGPIDTINSSGGMYGESEQIVITSGQYIYTRNGRVTQWQQ